MKKLLLIAMIVMSQSIWADGISVISFKLLETDLTANTRGTERRDQRDRRENWRNMAICATASTETYHITSSVWCNARLLLPDVNPRRTHL